MFARIFMLSLAIACFLGCGGDEYDPAEGGGAGVGGSGGVTGILLNLQRPAGEVGAKTGTGIQWQVMAPSGAILFTRKNCPTGVLGPVVAFERAKALSDSNLLKIGETFVELRISKATYDESTKVASYFLDQGSMTEVSSVGNFMALVQEGKLVMLFGRDGK